MKQTEPPLCVKLWDLLCKTFCAGISRKMSLKMTHNEVGSDGF